MKDRKTTFDGLWGRLFEQQGQESEDANTTIARLLIEQIEEELKLKPTSDGSGRPQGAKA